MLARRLHYHYALPRRGDVVDESIYSRGGGYALRPPMRGTPMLAHRDSSSTMVHFGWSGLSKDPKDRGSAVVFVLFLPLT